MNCHVLFEQGFYFKIFHEGLSGEPFPGLVYFTLRMKS